MTLSPVVTTLPCTNRWKLLEAVELAGGSNAAPYLVDMDYDDDYDLMIGRIDGIAYGYKNTGSKQLPPWVPPLFFMQILVFYLPLKIFPLPIHRKPACAPGAIQQQQGRGCYGFIAERALGQLKIIHVAQVPLQKTLL